MTPGARGCSPSTVRTRAAGLSEVWNRSCSLPAFRRSAKFLLMNLSCPRLNLLPVGLVGGTHRQADLLPYLDAVYVAQLGVQFAQLGDDGVVIATYRPSAQLPNSVVGLNHIGEGSRCVRISARACRFIKLGSRQGCRPLGCRFQRNSRSRMSHPGGRMRAKVGSEAAEQRGKNGSLNRSACQHLVSQPPERKLPGGGKRRSPSTEDSRLLNKTIQRQVV